MKRAIITGATGFVGSNLCKYLIDNDWKVFVISRPSSNYTNINDILNKIKVFEYDGDVENLISYFNKVKADVIFHLASFVSIDHSSIQIDSLIDSNIKFGMNILEAMKKSQTKLLINTGTFWQHYNSNEYNPVNLYAATKQAFVSLIRYYVEVENIKVITLKLFDTYGEFDTRIKLINLLDKFSREGKQLDMSPGEQLLDLVHIDDVVRAYVIAYEHLLKYSIGYQEYGISSGKPIKLKNLIEIFEKIKNKKNIANLGALEYRNREVMIPWNSYEQLPNWSPYISLEEGLRRFNNY